MVVSVFLAATVLPTVKWVLMSGLMPRKAKILCGHHVLAVEFVLQYVEGMVESVKIHHQIIDLHQTDLSNSCYE